MEIAKFVLAAIGTFVSVITLSFGVFQYWKKKQEEKFDGLRDEMKTSVSRLGERVESLEKSVVRGFESRLSTIEGELKGQKSILIAIQNWFINSNTGKKE